jgi:hypothetical protein
MCIMYSLETRIELEINDLTIASKKKRKSSRVGDRRLRRYTILDYIHEYTLFFQKFVRHTPRTMPREPMSPSS